MIENKHKFLINNLVRQYLDNNKEVKINISSDYRKIVISNNKDVGIVYSLLKDLRDLTGLDSFYIEEVKSPATNDTFYIVNVNEGD